MIVAEKTITVGKKTYKIAKSELNNGFAYWVLFNDAAWPKVFNSFEEMINHYAGLKDLEYF